MTDMWCNTCGGSSYFLTSFLREYSYHKILYDVVNNVKPKYAKIETPTLHPLYTVRKIERQSLVSFKYLFKIKVCLERLRFFRPV